MCLQSSQRRRCCLAAVTMPQPRLKRRLQPKRHRRLNRRRLKLHLPSQLRRRKPPSNLREPVHIRRHSGRLKRGRSVFHLWEPAYLGRLRLSCVFSGRALLRAELFGHLEGEMEVSRMKPKAINALVLALASLTLLGCNQNTTPAPAPAPGPQVTPPAEPPPPPEPPPAEPAK
jgi:hypothetical protein